MSFTGPLYWFFRSMGWAIRFVNWFFRRRFLRAGGRRQPGADPGVRYRRCLTPWRIGVRVVGVRVTGARVVTLTPLTLTPLTLTPLTLTPLTLTPLTLTPMALNDLAVRRRRS